MTDPAAPYPPPPPPGPRPPAPGTPGRPLPSNGAAVAALVLGITALVLSPIPLLNLLGLLLALVGIGLGIAGIVRGRRTGWRTAMAAWGTGLSVVALGVSVVVSFVVFRYLGDLLDFVEPPEPSAEIGERFTTDEGDLSIEVTSVDCGPAETPGDPTPEADGLDSCRFTFQARNESDTTVYLDHIKVKGVVDGAWRDPTFDEGKRRLEPGASGTISGRISLIGGTLEGLAFDGDDASSHSAVVVDTRPAATAP